MTFLFLIIIAVLGWAITYGRLSDEISNLKNSRNSSRAYIDEVFEIISSDWTTREELYALLVSEEVAPEDQISN